MLLALDMIPSSEFLWNRCEGVEVEPPARHGTVTDLTDQLEALRFRINERRVVRSIPGARTDLLLIELHPRDRTQLLRARSSGRPGLGPDLSLKLRECSSKVVTSGPFRGQLAGAVASG